jgi:thioesterase domain-containing protein
LAVPYYSPKVYPGKITLYCSTESLMDMAKTSGWSQLTDGGLEINEIPGDHYTIIREPVVQVLAERLKELLL